MSSTKLIALRAATLLGVLSTVPLAGYADDGRPDGRGRPPLRGQSMPPAFGALGFGPPPIMHLVRELDMSDTQRDQVFAVLDRYQPGLRKLMFSLGDGRDALNSVLSQGGFDPARLEQDAATQGRAAQDLYVMTARMLSEIGALLTSEQRARLDRMTGSDVSAPPR